MEHCYVYSGPVCLRQLLLRQFYYYLERQLLTLTELFHVACFPKNSVEPNRKKTTVQVVKMASLVLLPPKLVVLDRAGVSAEFGGLRFPLADGGPHRWNLRGMSVKETNSGEKLLRPHHTLLELSMKRSVLLHLQLQFRQVLRLSGCSLCAN